MANNPKVFIVSPALSMGGMERASVNTANGLRQLGCEVVFLSFFKKDHFFKLDGGVKLLEPTGFNITSLSLFQSILWIRKEIKRERPDTILVFSKLYGAITALSLVGLDAPLYISERSSPLFKWRFHFELISKIAYFLNPPKGVIAQTKIAAEYQKKYFKKSKVLVIPNSVRDVTMYPEIKRKKVILAVGRLNDHLKGFDLLLDSIALLKNQDWELHIAGGDEEGDELKRQAVNLNIRHRVKFLGKIKDIDRCYAYAGIFVIPSRSEGFPNVLAEAMAAGCCCLAFDFVAGPQDMIDNNENGFIVPQNDIKKMAQKIDYLILNRDKRIKVGEKATLIRNSLNVKFISRKIYNLILDIHD